MAGADVQAVVVLEEDGPLGGVDWGSEALRLYQELAADSFFIFLFCLFVFVLLLLLLGLGLGHGFGVCLCAMGIIMFG